MFPLYRIVCPIDFSPTSFEALNVARQLARRTNPELILIHVIPFPTPNEHGYKSEEEAHHAAYQNAENQLKEIIATRLRYFENTRFMIFSGSPPGQLIVDATRSQNADLIVIGTHGWTGWRRLVLGSVTEEVMHFAECPVLTVRSKTDNFAAFNSRPKILCPTDFSEPSVQALQVAGEFAVTLNDDLSILHVLEPLSDAFADMSAEEFSHLRMDAALQSMVPLIKSHLPTELQPGAQSHRILRNGKPGAEIVKAAEEGEFDLIVMATQGQTGWRHLFVGSVADEVVRTAPCPVLTIGHGTRHKINISPAVISGGDKNSISIEAVFPVTGSSEEKLRFLLRYAILAPSNRNAQPWRWRLKGDILELYADRTRALPHLDPDDHELILSCGAALLHLRLAIRHFGFKDDVTIFPDRNNSDLLAAIQIGKEESPSSDEELLFSAIPQRHTNRYPFIERDLPASMKTALQAEAASEGINLLLVEDTDTRFAVIKLIARSSLEQGHDPQLIEETLSWIRQRRSRVLSADGIPLEAIGGGGMLSHYAADVGVAQSEKDEFLAWSAPLLAVLQTEEDRPPDWLAAGQALARVLLRAAAEGVQASFFNSPIEVVPMWAQLRQILKCAGLPQVILRLGYPSEETGSTPRRRVDDVFEVAS